MLLIDRTLLPLTPPGWLADLTLLPFDAPRLPADPPAAVRGLLLRSTTRLGADDLRRMPGLRAVCTASSGTDHLDVEALARAGVRLGHGRGGNAIAVADHVLWGLTRTLRLEGIAQLAGRRVVVVGCGAVGSEVMARLSALGARPVGVDPPRAMREPGFHSVSLQDALARPVDALTLHVPLTDRGPHATAGLVDGPVIDGLRGAVLLNAARGGVMDEAAAVRARSAGALSGLCVDTFVGEPSPDPEVIAGCDLATPHIAGHSLEGKLRVTWLAIAALREALALAPPPPLEPEIAALRAVRQATDPAFRPLEALDALSARFRAQAREAGAFGRLRSAHARYELQAPGCVA